MAKATVGGVAVNHGVHIARRHPKKQIGLPLGFQYSADNRHAKTGVVDIGVTGHNDDVAAIPA